MRSELKTDLPQRLGRTHGAVRFPKTVTGFTTWTVVGVDSWNTWFSLEKTRCACEVEMHRTTPDHRSVDGYCLQMTWCHFWINENTLEMNLYLVPTSNVAAQSLEVECAASVWKVPRLIPDSPRVHVEVCLNRTLNPLTAPDGPPPGMCVFVWECVSSLASFIAASAKVVVWMSVWMGESRYAVKFTEHGGSRKVLN